MKKINVSIIEDNLVFREGLMHYIGLHKDFDIGCQAATVASFLQEYKIAENFPEPVLLLDIGLPGINGIDAIPVLLEQFPGLHIIMLTTYQEEESILRSLCAGASSYISKSDSMENIVSAIRDVVAGGSYMSPAIARQMINHLVGGRTSKATILTERQREILNKLSEGKSYAVIGKELFISTETVRAHVKKMYRVLQVNNKTEAIARYLRGEIN